MIVLTSLEDKQLNSIPEALSVSIFGIILPNCIVLNSSIALTYSYREGILIDLDYSNVVGTQDIGRTLKVKENRIGTNLNFVL